VLTIHGLRRAELQISPLRCREKEQAGPSTTLRFGRDDNSFGNVQNEPAVIVFHSLEWAEGPMTPPVEMTIYRERFGAISQFLDENTASL
jgi:hypothetical protein